MNRLSLSSKGKTLEDLKTYLSRAKVLPLFRFSVNEYRKNKNELIKNIENKFQSKLIIRSSSHNEDNEDESNAGSFQSVTNVNHKDSNAIKDGIDIVVQSYGKNISNNDEIFIQPMLESVEMAGVIFSSDIDTLSDYYVINYDESGSTDSVTSGKSNNLKTFISFKENKKFNNLRFKEIIFTTKECEKIFDNKYLDIEFAFVKKQLYILQVRPIVKKGKNDLSDINLGESIEKIRLKIENLNSKHPNLLGDKAIFGVMPDWNPAEIIGLRPKSLALSLYKELITDETWAHQRDSYGYRNLNYHPLLVSFLGVPYIDVRVSFNSFIPKKLDELIAEKLVNHYLNELEKNKSLHDKVEFEIVYSCYYFGIEKKLDRLKNNNFTNIEISEIQNNLLEITNIIIHPIDGLYKKDLRELEKLKKVTDDIVSSKLSLIDKIYWLIKDVKRYGTLPFAGAARSAFVAIQFLKSFISEGIINEKEYNLFLKSLNTVSKSLVKDKNILNKKDFLDKYGHLRPGTYDILSKNYEQNYENYFSKENNDYIEEEIFTFSASQKKCINEKLLKYKLNVNFEQLIEFIKGAIEAREFIKFEFTKSLNLILNYITDFGLQLKYGKFYEDDLAHLNIQKIISLYSSLDHRHVTDILKNDISKNREFYRYTQAIKLPSVITSSEDVFSFMIDESKANFITLKSIMAQVINEESIQDGTNDNLEGKIVCIMSADPGYDYLFSRNIGGLITCYGGANSHMAIRCSELGIPAVIGCGEKDFRVYNKSSLIELNSSDQKVVILK